MNIRLGTCGYSYKEWKGVFYPENLSAGGFLEYYAGRFDTVEVNATYYRLPALKALEGMVRRTPPGFAFFIKAHQALTHVRGGEAETVLPAFEGTLKPFQEAGKLAGVLLQFPYSFRPAPDSIRYIEELAGRLEKANAVVEFRHRDWFEDEHLEWLKKAGISICCVDEPPLPNLPPPLGVVTGRLGYVRFHGRNRDSWWGKGPVGSQGRHEDRPAGARYNYLYSDAELKEWVPKLRSMAADTENLYAFFNNHPEGQAVINARGFRSILSEVS